MLNFRGTDSPVACLVSIVHGLSVSVRPCLNADVLHDSYVPTNSPYCW